MSTTTSSVATSTYKNIHATTSINLIGDKAKKSSKTEVHIQKQSNVEPYISSVQDLPQKTNEVEKSSLLKQDESIKPYIDIKVNGQDGPITVNLNSYVTVSWTSKGVLSCVSNKNNKSLSGSEIININAQTTNPFVIKCVSTDGDNVSDSVSLNINGSNIENIDPYGVVPLKSGDVYTPDQLNLIDCTYHGTNCKPMTTIYQDVQPASVQKQVFDCWSYQVEQKKLDESYAQNGTLFSGARANADSALKAKYASCF